MKNIVIWVAVAVVGAAGGWVWHSKWQHLNQYANTQNVVNTSTTSPKASIVWNFTSAGEVNAMPYTNVSVDINGVTYQAGKFTGSCNEVGATGGIDGKGLLAGELSAVQCWFAGGGDEVGVFANEGGGYDIMVGGLSEGGEESPMFRGDFKIKTTVQ